MFVASCSSPVTTISVSSIESAQSSNSDDVSPKNIPRGGTQRFKASSTIKPHYLSTSTQPDRSQTFTSLLDSREVWAEAADYDARFAQQLEELGVTFPEGGSIIDFEKSMDADSNKGSTKSSSSSRSSSSSSSSRRGSNSSGASSSHSSSSSSSSNSNSNNSSNSDSSNISTNRSHAIIPLSTTSDSKPDRSEKKSKRIPMSTLATNTVDLKEERKGLPDNNATTNSPFALIKRDNAKVDDDNIVAYDDDAISNETKYLRHSEHDDIIDGVTDGVTRALLVQNQRLIERVKDLESILEKTTATNKKIIQQQKIEINHNMQKYVDVQDKYDELILENKKKEQKYEAIIIDRVKKATLLHLKTKEDLLNELSIIKKKLHNEKKVYYQEKGAFEGKILNYENIVRNNKTVIQNLKNNLIDEKNKYDLLYNMNDINQKEYNKRENEHFEDMRLCTL
jgi:hypothetical protein